MCLTPSDSPRRTGSPTGEPNRQVGDARPDARFGETAAVGFVHVLVCEPGTRRARVPGPGPGTRRPRPSPPRGRTRCHGRLRLHPRAHRRMSQGYLDAVRVTPRALRHLLATHPGSWSPPMRRGRRRTLSPPGAGCLRVAGTTEHSALTRSLRGDGSLPPAAAGDACCQLLEQPDLHRHRRRQFKRS